MSTDSFVKNRLFSSSLSESPVLGQVTTLPSRDPVAFSKLRNVRLEERLAHDSTPKGMSCTGLENRLADGPSLPKARLNYAKSLNKTVQKPHSVRETPEVLSASGYVKSDDYNEGTNNKIKTQKHITNEPSCRVCFNELQSAKKTIKM
jgi:hypothetical protein